MKVGSSGRSALVDFLSRARRKEHGRSLSDRELLENKVAMHEYAVFAYAFLAIIAAYVLGRFALPYAGFAIGVISLPLLLLMKLYRKAISLLVEWSCAQSSSTHTQAP